MKAESRNKPLEIFWNILASLCLIYAGTLSPVMSIFLFLSCFPILLVMMKYGYNLGFICFVLIGLALILNSKVPVNVLKVPFDFTYILLFISLGIGTGILIKQGMPATRIIMLGSGLFVGTVLLWVVFSGIIFKVNTVNVLLNGIDSVQQQVMQEYRNNPPSVLGSKITLDQNQLIQMEEQLKAMVKSVKNGLPALLAVFSIIGVGFSYLVGARVFSYYGIRLMQLPKFMLWRPAEDMVWGLILGAILYIVGSYGDRYSAIHAAGLNICIFFLFIYFIAGLSIINYFFFKHKIPFMIRAIGYLMFVLQYPAALILGIVDAWFDFRSKIDSWEKKAREEKNTDII